MLSFYIKLEIEIITNNKIIIAMFLIFDTNDTYFLCTGLLKCDYVRFKLKFVLHL